MHMTPRGGKRTPGCPLGPSGMSPPWTFSSPAFTQSQLPWAPAFYFCSGPVPLSFSGGKSQSVSMVEVEQNDLTTPRPREFLSRGHPRSSGTHAATHRRSTGLCHVGRRSLASSRGFVIEPPPGTKLCFRVRQSPKMV
ncbi:hypothetical protein H1C71_039962 [Ictidomys tridecemlineatus]|nr:hypothetical protein H1C71_039962 [Ictidomys tridecemlineatus]